MKGIDCVLTLAPWVGWQQIGSFLIDLMMPKEPR